MIRGQKMIDSGSGCRKLIVPHSAAGSPVGLLSEVDVGVAEPDVPESESLPPQAARARHLLRAQRQTEWMVFSSIFLPVGM